PPHRAPVPSDEIGSRISLSAMNRFRTSYMNGSRAFTQSAANILPPIDGDSMSSAYQEVLWEYYYMGFQYSENRRNEALAARPAAPSSISVPPPPAPAPVPVPAPVETT